MAILITGGAGYIGSHTCVELQNSGYDIVVMDNLYNSKRGVIDRIEAITGKKVPFYQVDIRDKAGMREVFRQNKIDAVIHFAGLKAVGESVRIPLSYYDNNIAGTVALCEVMAEFGVKRIVFSSSATVYGTNETMPLTEDMPLGAINPYGRTKLFIEEILRDLAVSDPEWSISILRYFNPIGAHESGTIGEDPKGIPNNLMPYIAQVAVGRLDHLNVFGNDYPTVDGTGVRDYIHVVDLARGHVCAVKWIMEHTGCDAVNLGTGNGVSVLQLVKAFEQASGVTIPYEITARRAGDPATVYADASKAKAVLGWEAQLTAEDMCASTWNWQSKNPNGYTE